MTDVDADMMGRPLSPPGPADRPPSGGCPVPHGTAERPVARQVSPEPGTGCPFPHGAASPAEPDAVAGGCPYPEAATAERSTVCGYAGKGKRGYFVPGLIALLVLLAAGGLINAGALSHASPHRLDGTYVATQIADNYQTAHHLESPPSVRCPNDEPVAAGHRFVCQMQGVPGGATTVTVTETGDGQIQVGTAP